MTPTPVIESAGSEFLIFIIAAAVGLCLLRKLFKPRPKYQVEHFTRVRRVK